MILLGFVMNAQHAPGRNDGKMHRREQVKDFTPEQKAELQTKRMTLELDLTDAQQNTIKAHILQRLNEREKAKGARKANREAGKRPGAEERFAMENRKLDEKIATKAFYKKTLSTQQFEKLENMKQSGKEKITKKREIFKKRYGR